MTEYICTACREPAEHLIDHVTYFALCPGCLKIAPTFAGYPKWSPAMRLSRLRALNPNRGLYIGDVGTLYSYNGKSPFDQDITIVLHGPIMEIDDI